MARIKTLNFRKFGRLAFLLLAMDPLQVAEAAVALLEEEVVDREKEY